MRQVSQTFDDSIFSLLRGNILREASLRGAPYTVYFDTAEYSVRMIGLYLTFFTRTKN